MSTVPELEAFSQLLKENLHLASEFERIAAYEQGKGYGEATIAQEVGVICHLLGAPPRLAVDIGGNVGDYTATLKAAAKDVEIHTFEPSATNLDILRKRFAGDDSIIIAPFAVADTGGPAVLFADRAGSGLGSLSRRRLDHFAIKFDVSEPVTTIRFEDYWNDVLGRRPIDIAKLDIEGHELAALRGFGEAVQSIKAIQFEFGGGNIDTRTYFQDFWYFFQEEKFDLFRIAPIGVDVIATYSEADEYFSTTNYIAVNRDKG